MQTAIIVLVYTLVIGVLVFDLWVNNLNYKNRNANIPEEVNDIYDQSEYKKWLEYYMENHRFSQISSLVNTVVFLLFLVFRIFPLFAEISDGITSDFSLNTIVFLGLYYIIQMIIGLPFRYYRTFVIEEKYGFNKTTRKTFWLDRMKGLIMTIILGGGFIYGLTVLYESTGNMFYLYTWLSVIVIILVIQMIYVPVIIPIFNKLTPLEDGELKDMIHEFGNKVGYEVTKISVMDASRRSTKLNAFFTGFGRFKQVVLYDTLIEKMSNEEIVAVLAHEIGHNKHKHITYNLIQTAFTLSIYIGLLVMVINVKEFSTAFNFTELHFGFAIILFNIVVSPISILIGIPASYLSRKYEFQADNYAATKFKQEPMVTALKVLSKENFSNLTPHPLYVKLFYSHPPVAQRIREIRKV